MNDPMVALLGIFSIFIYLSTLGFFWGIYHENCSALNRLMTGKSLHDESVKFTHGPVNPDFRKFLHKYWRPFTLFGVLYSGIFGFFIEHVCHYN